MPGVQRKGDQNTAGGRALSGVSSVRVNGIPVVVEGTPVTGHGRGPHASPQTRGGNGSVRVGGVPIITDGCTDTCGHPRRGGSPNVRVG